MFAIISRDAGGAELVSRFAFSQKENFCLSLSGPAIKIFKNKFGKIKNLTKSQAIKKSDWVLCSTGTWNNYEKDGIIMAKKNKKKVVVFLDHWVNYRKRFYKNNKLNLPDEIWVGDKYAFDLAIKKKLKNVYLKKNPFFEDFKKKMKNFKVNNKNKKIKKIIFLSEPVIGKVKKYYDERKCLSFFLKNIHLLKLKFSKISIRPHPGEKKSKFEWIKKYSNRIVISNKKHIFNDILENDIIVGINTVALVLGVMAKKKVISCIPTNKVKCYLPHKKILDFKKIIYEKN